MLEYLSQQIFIRGRNRRGAHGDESSADAKRPLPLVEAGGGVAARSYASLSAAHRAEREGALGTRAARSDASLLAAESIVEVFHLRSIRSGVGDAEHLALEERGRLAGLQQH